MSRIGSLADLCGGQQLLRRAILTFVQQRPLALATAARLVLDGASNGGRIQTARQLVALNFRDDFVEFRQRLDVVHLILKIGLLREQDCRERNFSRNEHLFGHIQILFGAWQDHVSKAFDLPQAC